MRWLLLAATVGLTAVANLLLRYAGLHKPETAPDLVSTLWGLVTNLPWVLGIFCLAAAVVPYGLALRDLPLSVAYPVMTASVMVLVAVISLFVFGESLTVTKVVGTAVVIAGVALLSL